MPWPFPALLEAAAAGNFDAFAQAYSIERSKNVHAIICHQIYWRATGQLGLKHVSDKLCFTHINDPSILNLLQSLLLKRLWSLLCLLSIFLVLFMPFLVPS